MAPGQVFNPGGLGHYTMRSGCCPADTWVHFECGDFFGSRVFICGAVVGGIYELYSGNRKLLTCSAGRAGVIQIKSVQNVTEALKFKLIK